MIVGNCLKARAKASQAIAYLPDIVLASSSTAKEKKAIQLNTIQRNDMWMDMFYS